MHSSIEIAWRHGGGFALAQLLDHGQHYLPVEDAFPLQQLYQRGYAGLWMHHPSPRPITIVLRHVQVGLPHMVP